ncbi:hypothetical protein [Pseudomonas sp. GM_Psu_2]|uniref:hypothetical protein n=1 Tax=unclassified Pseudomonas TaxID=196821 RepID=UPI0022699BA8|nr:hypothetical protein [Pseudomonas sp. GM_Psu_2]
MSTTTAPNADVDDLQQLFSATSEARALLQNIAEMDALPTGRRIDALRELSDAAENLAWQLVQVSA